MVITVEIASFLSKTTVAVTSFLTSCQSLYKRANFEIFENIGKKADPNFSPYRGRYSEGAAAKEPMRLFTKNTGLC